MTVQTSFNTRLRHRITLQQEDTTADAAGQLVPAWTDYRVTWAEVKDRSGREIQRGDQTEAIVQTVVTLRYPRSGRFPVPQDRVSYKESQDITRTLNIDAVKRADAERRYIELFCSEVQ